MFFLRFKPVWQLTQTGLKQDVCLFDKCICTCAIATGWATVTQWCHSPTILTSLSHTPLSTVAHPVPAGAKSCSPESVCSESLLTQKIRNRSIRRIHCRSSSRVYLPPRRSWPAPLRLWSQKPCHNSTDRSTWQSQLVAASSVAREIQARWACKSPLGQTIYAAERLGAKRLTSIDPAGPAFAALGRQQACTPPQPIYHNAGHQGERQAGQECQGRSARGTPEGITTRTPDSIAAAVQSPSSHFAMSDESLCVEIVSFALPVQY